MRKVTRNPLAAHDPYAVPFLSGSTWWDFTFGPLCRRLAAKYGIAIDDTVTPAEQPPIPATIVNPHFADHALDLDLLEAASGLGERRARRYDEPMAAAIPFDAFNLDKEAS